MNLGSVGWTPLPADTTRPRRNPLPVLERDTRPSTIFGKVTNGLRSQWRTGYRSVPISDNRGALGKAISEPIRTIFRDIRGHRTAATFREP